MQSGGAGASVNGGQLAAGGARAEGQSPLPAYQGRWSPAGSRDGRPGPVEKRFTRSRGVKEGSRRGVSGVGELSEGQPATK